jgi:oligosaccharide reducing-end xylanase
MRPRPGLTRWLFLVGAVTSLAACRTTLDSLGCKARSFDGGSPDGGVALAPLLGPASYPNVFTTLLGRSDTEVATKVESVFQQLFHGDPSTQAIYVTTGTNMAYIEDVLHNEARTEGIGLGMMIAVALGKRDEFDRLWRYVKTIQVTTGPAAGYLQSYCGGGNGANPCYDPFGLEQIATAMLLARGRWQATATDIDYATETAGLLDLMRNKEVENCGIVGGITSTFDAQSKLPYDLPTTGSAGISHPSYVMPAYYDLWFQATGDPFWSQAAAAARAYWKASANPTTGLMPERATFDGTPVPNHDIFNTECLRIFYNIALDRIWSGGEQWLVDESNRLLEFFDSKGLTTYGYAYSLDGTTTVNTIHDTALIAANGTLALVATDDIRRDFAGEVWNLTTPTGGGRYYPGINQLFALVLLSGQMRVY